MNAILLAGACAGALIVFLTADPEKVAAAKEEAAHGFMTRDVTVNPKTGAEEETMVLGFLDAQ
jgi:hypothetical protein